MEVIIELENVTKVFGEEEVIKNVSFALEKSKVYGIVGKNGSGKSVLFKLILGLFLPTKGFILVNNKKTSDGEFPRNIGAILDKSGFIPHYSAFNNLKLIASIRGIINDDDIRKTLDFVGLDSKSRKHFKKFSLGMKQRLAIAQAIMENPDILILDEPMNGLDASGIKEIRNMLLQLKAEGKTILIASHNMEDIDTLCDEVYEIVSGEITKKVKA